MTRLTSKALWIAAALPLLASTAAVAEPGPESIMLEKIGAVRMATPDELRQQQAPASARGDLVPLQDVH